MSLWIPFAIIFAATLLVGVLSLVYHNRFSAKQARIQEALENISLFLGQRQSALEALKPLLDRFDQGLQQDLRQALEIGQNSNSTEAIPQKTTQLAQSDRLTRSIIGKLHKQGHENLQTDALDRLERTEVELNGARRYHNALVREHNTLVKGFPSALVAVLFRIHEKPYLNTDAE